MKLGPDLFAGLLGHAPEAASLVPKGHHKQPRASVAARLRIVGQCAFAIIDLSFFAGGERETIELLGINVAQGAHETLDALVARGECELVDQILINRRRVSPQADLLFDPLAMRFACGAGEIERCRLAGSLSSRWSRRWGSLRDCDSEPAVTMEEFADPDFCDSKMA